LPAQRKTGAANRRSFGGLPRGRRSPPAALEDQRRLSGTSSRKP